MSTEQQQLEAALGALEAQRGLLGDAVADAAIAPLRAKLATLAATPPDAVDRTLKLVTVLFLDIVGSTSLSQRLDPEDISTVLDGALSRFATIVEQHRGKVSKYAGVCVA